MMDDLPNGDEGRQCVAHHRESEGSEESARQRGQFKGQRANPLPPIRTESAAQGQRHGDGNAEGAVVPVERLDGGHQSFDGTGLRAQIALGRRQDAGILGVGSRDPEGRPDQCRRAQVALADHRVAPAAVGIGMRRQPGDAAANEVGVGFWIYGRQGGHGGRGG